MVLSLSPLPKDLDKCLNCGSVLSSLEVEQMETARLQKENKALVNGIFQLQNEVLLLILLFLFLLLWLVFIAAVDDHAGSPGDCPADAAQTAD